LAAEGDAGLVATLGFALDVGTVARLLHIGANRLLLPGAGDQRLDSRVLGGDDKKCRSEKSVGTGREYGKVEIDLVAAEDNLGPLRAADPVALHRDDVIGPGLEQVEILEQPV